MADVRLTQQGAAPQAVSIDLLLTAEGQLDTGQELATAVTIALMTDALAAADDELPDARDPNRRGWWGDLDAGPIWDGNSTTPMRNVCKKNSYAAPAPYPATSVSSWAMAFPRSLSSATPCPCCAPCVRTCQKVCAWHPSSLPCKLGSRWQTTSANRSAPPCRSC